MKRFRLPSLFLALSAASIHAEVKMPSIFGDHMVLQQDGKIPVWGTAAPGEKVTASVGTNTGTATADADGKWRIDLAAMRATSTALTMTVTGSNSLTFQDVLVGDVWLASGQSNMELALASTTNGKQVISQANNPQLRLFLVQRQTGLLPKTDMVGTWKLCTPEALSQSYNYAPSPLDPQGVPPFSAIGYYFGQQLQSTLNRPIGIVGSYWGGTPIQTWMSLESLKALPETAGGVPREERLQAAFPKDPAAQAALMEDWRAKHATWLHDVEMPFREKQRAWIAASIAARLAGRPQPAETPPRRIDNGPPLPDGNPGEYAALYNGMIAPLIPYAMKGVLWYQGESNAGDVKHDYAAMLAAMITDWRAKWGEGDFSFFIVTIAGYGVRYPYPVDGGIARLRQSQARVAATLPHTALAAAVDLGGGGIHPVDKADVAKRLAADAFHITYGLNDVPCAGPRYDTMAVEGAKVRLKFKDIGSGLTIGSSPYVGPDNPALPTDHLVGFAVAGADQKFFSADATIDGNDVEVSSDKAPRPVAVRYAWADNPTANLYNKEGFPAVPFRTDNWPYVAPPPVPPGK